MYQHPDTEALNYLFPAFILISFPFTGGCNAAMEGCLKCRNSDVGGGSLCMKCSHLIVMESRECVDSCPLGYREEWSSQIDYMGRVCAGLFSLPSMIYSSQ